MVRERHLLGGVLVHRDEGALDDEGDALVAGRDVDDRHRGQAVLVLDDIGNGVGVIEDVDLDLAVHDPRMLAEHLGDRQIGTIDVVVVGQHVDDGRGLARLRFGDIVAGHRWVLKARDRVDEHAGA